MLLVNQGKINYDKENKEKANHNHIMLLVNQGKINYDKENKEKANHNHTFFSGYIMF